MSYTKYTTRIIIFLSLILIVIFINFPYLETIFLYNKYLNSAILSIFFLGVFLSIKNISDLKKEQIWLSNYLSQKVTSINYLPTLLKDIKEEIEGNSDYGIEDKKSDIIFERLVARIDFDKEVNRYLIVVLVFLGLLGTFWGLLVTIDAVGKTIGELSIEDENILLTFLSLKEALKAPLSGMGTAFATSLLGLAASLSLGFIDLQYSKVQNDFLIFVEKSLFNLSKKKKHNFDEKSEANPEYILVLLSQTVEGINKLQDYLERSENSRKNVEELIENTASTITKINDEINIRNNQFQKGELISIEHLRNIDNNIEVFKNKLKDDNIPQLQDLSSQIKILAKTISLVKKEMKRKLLSPLNIWPGFVDAIATILLVFVFLLAIFMIAQTFLTQSISGKNEALQSLRTQLKKLDSDLEINIGKNKKLSELIFTLNQQIELLNLEKKNLETDIEEKNRINKKYKLNTNQLEKKVALLFEELGIERLNLDAEKEEKEKLVTTVSGLNSTILKLNKKLSELEETLQISSKEVENKNIAIKDLKVKLNIALKEKNRRVIRI